MNALATRLLQLADKPGDSPEQLLQHRFLISLGVLMSGGGLAWFGISIATGRVIEGLIPLSYVFLTAANLSFLGWSKNFGFGRTVQVTMSLVLPFLFQVALGGFHASGAVMLWAMLSLVGSLTFSSARQSLGWLGLFLVLTAVVAAADPQIANWIDPQVTASTRRNLLVINILLISSMVFGLVIYVTDRQRRANEALASANGTISALNQALEGQVDRAVRAEQLSNEASRAKSMFLANMSHELRTPLNAIIGHAELLADDGLGEQETEDVERIVAAGHHLLGLINGVLDLSRVEAGKMEVYTEPTETRQLIQSAIDAVRPIVVARDNALEVQIELEHDRFKTDPDKVKQILINLLSNAAKFTESGQIRLQVTQAAEQLTLTVADTGIGMDEATCAKVFDAFQQADASPTRHFGGTGLGLHLVRAFARLLDGEAEVVRSAPGEGTTVQVRVCGMPVVPVNA